MFLSPSWQTSQWRYSILYLLIQELSEFECHFMYVKSICMTFRECSCLMWREQNLVFEQSANLP